MLLYHLRVGLSKCTSEEITMARKKKQASGDAVIYARYSSHNQRDVSIEQQIEACRKYAASLGLKITVTYEDQQSAPHRQSPGIPTYDE